MYISICVSLFATHHTANFDRNSTSGNTQARSRLKSKYPRKILISVLDTVKGGGNLVSTDEQHAIDSARIYHNLVETA